MRFRNKTSSLRGTESGQAMVEFLLVILFVFLVFVSILQFILLMYGYTTLANSAKEGIRYAVVHGTGAGSASCSGPGSPGITCNDSAGDQVRIRVSQFASLSLQNVGISDVSVTYPGGCSAPGCEVKVTVSHGYNPLFLSWPNVTLNAAADGQIMN